MSTLNDRMDKWLVDQKDFLDSDTLVSYKSLYDKHVRDSIGRRKIKNVKHTDLKKLYTKMVEVDGLSVSTAQSLNSAVGQVLQEAVNDDLIRKNPAKDATAKLAFKHKDDIKEKDALTADQQKKLLTFVAASRRFNRMQNLLVVLFGTGMRIGEAVGLIASECGFGRKEIRIRRELRYRADENGHYRYILKEKTKTAAGRREIPMLPEVEHALRVEIKKHQKLDAPFEIGGKTGFIFLNKANKPFPPHAVFAILEDIVEAYNK